MSLSRIVRILGKGKQDNKFKKVVAIVGTVTNDVRLLNVPEGLKVCALKFTNQARARILKAKG